MTLAQIIEARIAVAKALACIELAQGTRYSVAATRMAWDAVIDAGYIVHAPEAS